MSSIPLFSANFSDIADRKRIMKEYANSDTPFSGTNSNGENIIISVYKDKIIVTTYQKNGWIRKNIYEEDRTEELFEGKSN